jgi:hypothetical protein
MHRTTDRADPLLEVAAYRTIQNFNRANRSAAIAELRAAIAQLQEVLRLIEAVT